MKHRQYSGKIQYIGDSNPNRGREWFNVTVHADGQRTVRATCEMDDSQILRDVVYTVNENWTPQDAFVRLTIGEKFTGSAWFNFEPGVVECESNTAAFGRLSQRVTVPGGPVAFGPHPVVCDVWHLGAIDRSVDAPEFQTISDVPMSSLLDNGGSGPMIEIHKTLYFQRYEPEQITVPAGTFDCLHYALGASPDEMEHIWCTPEDLMLVQLRNEELASTYQLVEFSATEGS